MRITNTIDNLFRNTNKLFKYYFYVSKDENGTDFTSGYSSRLQT